MDVVQSCAEVERNRQQLNMLNSQLTESRGRCDVATADSQQLADNLATAEQTSEQYRDALRAKVVLMVLCVLASICLSACLSVSLPAALCNLL